MCHGIPPGRLVLRDDIARELLAGDDARRPVVERDAGGDADVPSFAAEDRTDAAALTGDAADDGWSFDAGQTPR